MKTLIKNIKQNIPMLVSATAGLFLVFLLGLIIGYKQWPPSFVIGKFFRVYDDLVTNAQAYFFEVPTQHLRPRRFSEDGVTVPLPDQMQPGVTFVTGLFGNKLGARLYTEDGTLLHEWPVDFFKVAPEKMAYPFDALIHGDHLYASGDILMNLDARGLYRISACGDVVWFNEDKSHHSLTVDDAGDIWTPIVQPAHKRKEVFGAPFVFDGIARFDSETGEKLAEIDLVSMLIENDLVGLAAIYGASISDVMHLNDVDVLSADVAAAFPMFNVGDLMLSSRHFNQIWVLDGKTQQLKWWHSGSMIGQHDPDFQPNGTITVYDNRPSESGTDSRSFVGSKGGSRIIAIDPATDGHSVLFASSDKSFFYSPYRGKHQVLANNNILIAETDAGRALEVTPEGDIAWSFVNAYDETRVGWVMTATRYPSSYASIGNISCP